MCPTTAHRAPREAHFPSPLPSHHTQDAKAMLDAWGVGQEGCNNGALLLLAIRPRKFALYAGGGAQSAGMKPYVREAVLDRMKTQLRSGHTFDALAQAIVDVSDAMDGHSDRFITRWAVFVKWFFANLFWMLIGVVVLGYAAFLFIKKRRDDARIVAIRQRLDEIDSSDRELRAAAAERRAARFDATSCPICLESFRVGYNENTFILLECGHKVCCGRSGDGEAGCAEQWFGATNLLQHGAISFAQSRHPHCTCPVCRADCSLDAAATNGPGANGAAAASAAGAGGGGGGAGGGESATPNAGSGVSGHTRSGRSYSGTTSGRGSAFRSSSGQQSSSYQRNYMDDDMGIAYYGYDHGYDLRRARLSRLQRAHPAYITTAQVHELSRDWMSSSSMRSVATVPRSSNVSSSSVWHRGLVSTRVEAARVAAAARSASRSSSSSGSSSFGGGGSSGGGGSGGGW